MKFERIIFFGASVTAQRATVDGVISGYSPNVEEMLKAEYGSNIDIHRFAMVGSHFDSAANMCLFEFEHLLGDKTLLVSEWNTTTLPKFEARALRAYFDRLSRSETAVLNLVLPMLSCLDKERANIRQTRSAQGRNVWQLNLYKSDLDFRACIRDEQHTTAVGAKAYAAIIFDALKSLIAGDSIPRDEGEEISFRESNAPYPATAFRPLEGEFGPQTSIQIGLPSTVKSRTVQIYAKMLKGPETAQLRIEAGGQSHILDTWNQYTYYRHGWSSFAPISPSLKLEPGVDTVTVHVTNNIPDYAALAKGLEKPIAFMAALGPHSKSLRLVSGIYLLGGSEFTLKVEAPRGRY